MDTTATARTRTRTRTRNRRSTIESSHVSESAGAVRANRGRKKRSDNTKKIEGKEKQRVKDKEIITKPVIESTNPFFIAVCAPETYKPRISTHVSVGAADNGKNGSNSFIDERERERGVKTNVFLRHRNRNTNNHHHYNNNNNSNNYPNHFIHHPLLKQSRESDSLNSNTQNVTTGASTNVGIELSNEELFPSLSKSSVSVSCVGTKLNFKEMIMRNAASISTSTTTSGGESVTKESVSALLPPPTYPRLFPSSQKTISSGNIFLAAFQNNHDDEDDYNDDYTNDYNKPSSSFISSSSVLIDSCDKKYDRLYST